MRVKMNRDRSEVHKQPLRVLTTQSRGSRGKQVEFRTQAATREGKMATKDRTLLAFFKKKEPSTSQPATSSSPAGPSASAGRPKLNGHASTSSSAIATPPPSSSNSNSLSHISKKRTPVQIEVSSDPEPEEGEQEGHTPAQSERAHKKPRLSALVQDAAMTSDPAEPVKESLEAPTQPQKRVRSYSWLSAAFINRLTRVPRALMRSGFVLSHSAPATKDQSLKIPTKMATTISLPRPLNQLKSESLSRLRSPGRRKPKAKAPMTATLRWTTMKKRVMPLMTTLRTTISIWGESTGTRKSQRPTSQPPPPPAALQPSSPRASPSSLLPSLQ